MLYQNGNISRMNEFSKKYGWKTEKILKCTEEIKRFISFRKNLRWLATVFWSCQMHILNRRIKRLNVWLKD